MLFKDFKSYYNGYDTTKGKHCLGYVEIVEQLTNEFPLGQQIIGEEAERRFISLFGSLLRSINVLSAFDQFEGKELLTDGQMQDYQSNYLDLQEKWRKKKPTADKEVINDDLIFETELIRQVEINIDYILMLVKQYHQENCKNKEILVDISKAISASLLLRSKKDLIEDFISQVNADSDVEKCWGEYIQKQKQEELEAIIKAENLKTEETVKFVESAFRDGVIRTTGTDIDKILPPMSRFGGGNRQEKKSNVIEKLKAFFDRFFGL